MNQKVKSISRVSPIEAAQSLWSAMHEVAIATESFVRASLCDLQKPAQDPQQDLAIHELARSVHHAKACFAKATGWYPVSVYADRLHDGIEQGHISQQQLDNILHGAVHFDVLVESFTFRHPELQQQAVEQAYQELLATEPALHSLGDWAETILRRACADAIARLYGSKSIMDALALIEAADDAAPAAGTH